MGGRVLPTLRTRTLTFRTDLEEKRNFWIFTGFWYSYVQDWLRGHRDYKGFHGILVLLWLGHSLAFRIRTFRFFFPVRRIFSCDFQNFPNSLFGFLVFFWLRSRTTVWQQLYDFIVLTRNVLCSNLNNHFLCFFKAVFFLFFCPKIVFLLEQEKR